MMQLSSLAIIASLSIQSLHCCLSFLSDIASADISGILTWPAMSVRGVSIAYKCCSLQVGAKTVHAIFLPPKTAIFTVFLPILSWTLIPWGEGWSPTALFIGNPCFAGDLGSFDVLPKAISVALRTLHFYYSDLSTFDTQ